MKGTKTQTVLTAAEIASRCGVSHATVRRWIKSGMLTGYRLPGGHFRIMRPDFETFVADYHLPVDRNPDGV